MHLPINQTQTRENELVVAEGYRAEAEAMFAEAKTRQNADEAAALVALAPAQSVEPPSLNIVFDAIRGVVVGLVTGVGSGVVTAYVPNDPPPEDSSRPSYEPEAHAETAATAPQQSGQSDARTPSVAPTNVGSPVPRSNRPAVSVGPPSPKPAAITIAAGLSPPSRPEESKP